MNISEVINDIKLTLGLNTVALPYEKPVELVIQEILKTSIRTFSRFKPHIREGIEQVKNLRSPNEHSKKMGIYILPETFTVSRVQDAYAYPVSSDFSDDEINVNPFTVSSPFIGFGSYYPQDIINATQTGVAINKYAGITTNPPTSKWLGFNKIQLIGFPADSFAYFVVKCEHDMNGETIPESCVESFMELATLDVQRTLYNNLKNMNNVGSAFKEIQIKIDDWSGAENERKELIKNWTDVFHYDDLDLIEFF